MTEYLNGQDARGDFEDVLPWWTPMTCCNLTG